MFNALSGILAFVTAAVSLIYGTRIAWVSGKKCTFNENPADKKLLLSGSIPAATAVYFFGFLIVFGLFFDGFIIIFVYSLTNAILLSHLVVTIAMPEMRRKPPK